jgi:hypothetical protein
MAPVGAWPPNQPPYQPIIASRTTTATMPMTAFLLSIIFSIIPSLTLIAGLLGKDMIIATISFKMDKQISASPAPASLVNG